MTLIKPLLTAALIATPALMEVPGVFAVSAAGVVVTYANNKSSVVVSPAHMIDRPALRTPALRAPLPASDAGAGALRESAVRDAAAETPPLPAPLPAPDPCARSQNCGSIAPPM